MRVWSICILLFSCILAGCSSTQKSGNTEEPKSEESQVSQEALKEEQERIVTPFKETIADARLVWGTSEVGGCEIIATVLEIYDQLDTVNPGSPCGQLPCSALLRIDKIVRMGQLCGPLIVPGAKLKAYFKITLSKTDNLFPDMKQHFPGLEKNDTFEAAFVTTGNPEDEYQIVISGYKKAE